MDKNKSKYIICVAILIFAQMAVGYNSYLKPFDMEIISYVQGLENSSVTKFYTVITDVADTYQSIVITIILVLALFLKKFKREAVFLALTMLSCGILMPLLKNLIRRPRPDFHRLIEISGFSFPSGHSTSATILYLSLALIVINIIKGINKYIVFSIATLGILIIVSSRIYLGVHYPTDTIAGMSLGVIVVLTFYNLYYKRG